YRARYMDKTNVGQQREQSKALARHHAERTCIGCRAQGGSYDLLRFVCTPQGKELLDFSGHAPGREACVCCEVICLRKALNPAKLALALKQSIIIPDFDAVYQEVMGLLYK